MDAVPYDFCESVASHLARIQEVDFSSQLWKFAFKEHFDKRELFKIVIFVSEDPAEWKYLFVKLNLGTRSSGMLFSDFDRRFYRIEQIEVQRTEANDFQNVKSLSTFLAFLPASLSHSPSLKSDEKDLPEASASLFEAIGAARDFKDIFVRFSGDFLESFIEKQLHSANLHSLELRGGPWPPEMKSKVAEFVLTSTCMRISLCNFEFDFEFFKALVDQSKDDHFRIPPGEKRKITFRSAFSTPELRSFEESHQIEAYPMPDAIRGDEKLILEWLFVDAACKHHNYVDVAYTGDSAIVTVEQWRFLKSVKSK